MKRNLEEFEGVEFDLLVIGGGICGIAVALDGALRGLSVALLEKGDVGHATSSATLRIIHGGLRYLQHADIGRMRESIGERSTLLRIAPHMVEPFPFLVPTYGHALRGKEAMTVALALNDLVGADRNRKIRDRGRRIPRGRIVSRAEALRLTPGLRTDGLTGGAVYYDCRLYSSSRLTLAFAHSAAAAGATLANRATVTGFRRDGRRLTGAVVRDGVTGGEMEVRARTMVNATGPWSDHLVSLAADGRPARVVRRSKGVQVVLPGSLRMGIGVESRERDPDAIVSRGGRHLFLMPWRGKSLLGTTDTIFEGDPDDFRIEEREAEALVDEFRAAYPGAEFGPDDLLHAFGGLRPITDTIIEEGEAAASRRNEITTHGDAGIDNMISIVGVKYTTARFLGERTVDRVFSLLRRSGPPSISAGRPLFGGGLDGQAARFEQWLAGKVDEAPHRLAAGAIRHLARCYGSALDDLLRPADGDPRWAELLPGSDEVIRAAVLYGIREEMALTLEDLVYRRTALGSLGPPPSESVRACAEIAAAELGWDMARMEKEIAALSGAAASI